MANSEPQSILNAPACVSDHATIHVTARASGSIAEVSGFVPADDLSTGPQHALHGSTADPVNYPALACAVDSSIADDDPPASRGPSNSGSSESGDDPPPVLTASLVEGEGAPLVGDPLPVLTTIRAEGEGGTSLEGSAIGNDSGLAPPPVLEAHGAQGATPKWGGVPVAEVAPEGSQWEHREPETLSDAPPSSSFDLVPSTQGQSDSEAHLPSSQSASRERKAPSTSTVNAPSSLAPGYVEHIVNSGFRDIRSQSSFTMPWERGLAAAVFDFKSPSWPFNAPPHPGSGHNLDIGALEGVAVGREPKPKTPYKSYVARRMKYSRLELHEDALRQRALTLWRIIIEEDLESTQIGRLLRQLAESLKPEGTLKQVLQDTFAAKSTATLFKRGYSFLKYVQWCRGQGKQNPLQLREQDLYDFICSLRASGAAPTTASSFLEAVNFATSQLGISPGREHTVTSRIRGASLSQFLNKRRLKQAPPLQVTEVAMLERLVCRSPDVVTRIVVGYFLMCLHTCSRFSDCMQLENLKLEISNSGHGVIEAGTVAHKTAISQHARTTLLPLIGLSLGVESRWAEAWLAAREELNMSSCRYTLPAISHTGSFLSRRMTSGEGSAYLKDLLLEEGVAPQRAAALSTHSLKATLLSWAAKSGALDVNERRLLGHHLDPNLRSVVTYSRDALLSAVCRMGVLLERIRKGHFNPDASRAEQLSHFLQSSGAVPSEAPVMTDLQPPVASEDVLGEDDADGQSSASDVSEAALCEAVSAVSEHHHSHEPNVIGQSVWQHVVSGYLHRHGCNAKLVCGRQRTSNYNQRILAAEDIQIWPQCPVCFKQGG